MALSDYRLCDVCGGKAFYDQRLAYWDKGGVSTAPYRIAGKEQIADPKQNDEYGMRLDHLGDWAVVCEGCAQSHETVIRPRSAIPEMQAKPASGVWIPVSERLPEKGLRVLVFVPGSEEPVRMDEGWTVYYEDPYGMGGSQVATGEGWAEHDYEDVSHWMPLPGRPL